MRGTQWKTAWQSSKLPTKTDVKYSRKISHICRNQKNKTRSITDTLFSQTSSSTSCYSRPAPHHDKTKNQFQLPGLQALHLPYYYCLPATSTACTPQFHLQEKDSSIPKYDRSSNEIRNILQNIKRHHHSSSVRII
jgi:hypothetical protein